MKYMPYTEQKVCKWVDSEYQQIKCQNKATNKDREEVNCSIEIQKGTKVWKSYVVP